MSQTIRLLQDEHAQMSALLDLLESEIAVFRDGETPDYGLVQGVLDYFLTYPELSHHPKEDVVYLALRRQDPAAAKALGGLIASHDELALLTRRFARATIDQILGGEEVPRQWFGSLARDFVDTNRRHMAMEEAHFFPAALDKLTPGDWARIDAQVTDRADPLFGDAVEQRFTALRRSILAHQKAAAEASLA